MTIETERSRAQSEKAHLAWATTRAKGKWHFILLKGVLLWGGLMFVWLGLLYPYLSHSTRAFTPGVLAVSAIVCPFGGLLWGVWVWWLAERNFHKYEISQRNSQQ